MEDAFTGKKTDMTWYAAALGKAEGLLTVEDRDYFLKSAEPPAALPEMPRGLIFRSETGKLGDSEDSFLFCYTEIDPEIQNFVLNGSFEVLGTDGRPAGWQSGYGVFCVDTVRSESDTARCRNYLSVGRHRMGITNEHSAGMRVVSEYEDPTASEQGKARILDLSREAELPGRKQSIRAGEAYDFSLEKNDEGFVGFFQSAANQTQILFPGCDFLMKQDPGSLFIGFGVAGNLSLKVENITLSLREGKSSRTPEGTIRMHLPDYPFQRSAICATDKPEQEIPEKLHGRKKLYISPEGTRTGSGTRQSPLDLQTALTIARCGQTLIVTDGIYKPEKPCYIKKRQMDRGKRILLCAEHPGKAVIDGARLSTTAPVLILRGDGWQLKDLVFRNSPSAGLFLCGHDNVIERCEAYENRDTGILICSYPGDEKPDWPRNNRIICCDSHHNCDDAEENADGFGAKLSIGEGNVFFECTAHHNIDDGFDLYSKAVLGPTGMVTLENCIAWENGRILQTGTTEERIYRGCGFKLGGENLPVAHRVRNCIAFQNREAGFASNSNPNVYLRNTTAWRNGPNPVLCNYRMTTLRTDPMPDWQLSGLLPEQCVYYKISDAVTLPELIPAGKKGTKAAEEANQEMERYWTERFTGTELNGQISRGRDGLLIPAGLFNLKQQFREEYQKAGKEIPGARLDEGTLRDRFCRHRRYRQLVCGEGRAANTLQGER